MFTSSDKKAFRGLRARKGEGKSVVQRQREHRERARNRVNELQALAAKAESLHNIIWLAHQNEVQLFGGCLGKSSFETLANLVNWLGYQMLEAPPAGEGEGDFAERLKSKSEAIL